MADKKVSELSAITNLSGDDLLLVVNDPSGTPTSRKVTVSNLFANVVSDVVHKGDITHQGNTSFSGGSMTVSANATFSGTLDVTGTLVESGVSQRSGVQIFDANTIHNDTLFANGGLVISSSVSSGGSNIIGKNGNLNANNAISNGSILGNMIDPTVLDDYMQVANTFAEIQNQSNVQTISFYTAENGHTVGEGEISWNNTDGTLDLGKKGGDVTLQIGQENHVYVFNVSNTTIENGQTVYFETTRNSRLGVDKFVANNSITRSRYIGMATENISANSQGYITTFGYIRDVDARGDVANTIAVGDETWSNGDVLYAHPTSPGRMTNVLNANSESQILQTAIIIDNSENGSIFSDYRILNVMNDLQDFQYSPNPGGESIVRYNTSLNLFENGQEIRTVNTDPATSNAVTEGVIEGEMFASNTYLYVVTSNTTIKRITLETF